MGVDPTPRQPSTAKAAKSEIRQTANGECQMACLSVVCCEGERESDRRHYALLPLPNWNWKFRQGGTGERRTRLAARVESRLNISTQLNSTQVNSVLGVKSISPCLSLSLSRDEEKVLVSAER